jgi:hypothetical protein
VTELEAVPCLAANISEFESTVVVEFTGNPDNASEDQLAALEQGFLETYNELNSLNDETCDLTFKEVVTLIFLPSSLPDAISSNERRFRPRRRRLCRKEHFPSCSKSEAAAVVARPIRSCSTMPSTAS